MKTLLLDIETAPNTAYVWGLFNENIPLARLVESSYVLCWAAKWHGEKEVFFSSTYEQTPKKLLHQIHRLLEEAEAVIHYNGTRFDIPILNREFIQYGYMPPAPYKQIDLLRVARQKFKFASNKLEYVAKFLGVEHKLEPSSFKLWIDCMAGDEKAWKEMKAYNIQDVRVLEQVYHKMIPWIKNHPNHNVYAGEEKIVCTNCASIKYQRRGWAYTALSKYPRYQCGDCGSWFRGRSEKNPNKVTGII